MTVSSRTPEGEPGRCVLCNAVVTIEFSEFGDAACPKCGYLLWKSADVLSRFQAIFCSVYGGDADQFPPDLDLVEFESSLDVVELMMELEEEFGVEFNFDYASSRRHPTLADMVRHYLDQLKRPPEPDPD